MNRPVVLIVDDEEQFLRLYSNTLKQKQIDVVTATNASDALKIIRQSVPALVVSDIRMPGMSGIELLREARLIAPVLPFLFVTAYAEIRGAVQVLRMGAVDYLEKPLDLDEFTAAVCDNIGHVEDANNDLPLAALDGNVASNPIMKSLFFDAYRIAPTDVSVLLIGESGTGKEVLARFIHRNSNRSSQAFVAVNCASIPSSLLNSELFGHEKGAFTGALSRRNGLIRESSGGTLLLDEIGDMPLDLQASLLRCIETKKIIPVGSDREEPVDFRLIAATHRNLHVECELGRFREDLYYRLNVLTLEIPPLRERPEDIIELAQRFLSKGDGPRKRLSMAAIKALKLYSWPGNIRELANAIERAKLLSHTDVLLPEHFPKAIRDTIAHGESVSEADDSDSHFQTTTLQDNEVEAIRKALHFTNGNRTQAARMLGITRRGLIYKIKRLGL